MFSYALWQETKPLAEARWVGGAVIRGIQVENDSAGESGDASDNCEAAAPNDRSALQQINEEFKQAEEDVKDAAYRLQEEDDDEDDQAKQAAANRNIGQMRWINVLQQVHFAAPAGVEAAMIILPARR